MSFFVRLSGELPIFQKTFFRNIVASAILLPIVFKRRKNIHLQKEDFLPLFSRAVFGTAGLICNFYAIDHLNIADASMLNKLSPFFVMLMCFAVLGEKPTRMDWLTTIIAFLGMLFVAKPSLSIQGMGALAGIGGGICAGAAYTSVRVMGLRGVEKSIIIFFFSIFSGLVSLPLMLIDFKAMSGFQLLCLLGAGSSAMIGQLCITRAYTFAPAKEIGVFDYTQVLFSMLLGFAFLRQIPDIWSIIGYIIIIGMALMKWKYNLYEEGIDNI